LAAVFGVKLNRALHGVQPGRRGRRIVEDEARVALELGTDLGVLVRGVVVEDDVDDLADRDRLRTTSRSTEAIRESPQPTQTYKRRSRVTARGC